MTRTPLLALARTFPLLVLLALAACGDSSTDPGDGPGDVPELDPISDPDADDFCGRLGYLCTSGDVADEVFERSEELLGEARGRIESGDSNEATAAWLLQQEGVDDVDASPSAVVFRVNGGQPTWLLTPSFDGSGSRPGDVDPVEQNVVGHGTSRENSENRKKALVLTPFQFQFAANDPGPGIATILGGHRDYNHGGGITSVGNATLPSLGGADFAGRPTVDDFRGWDTYDVIAVSTHGSELTEDSFGCSIFAGELFCIAGVSTGQRIRSCAVLKDLYPDTPGLRCAGIPDVPGTYILVDTDFFAWEYGEFAPGLDKSIVFMGGCQTMKNGSMAYQLGGDRSEYFGWDESVHIVDMRAPAIRLFELLVQDGLTTEDAFDRMEDEGTASTTVADLKLRSNGDGLHIREITTLKNPLHPSVSGEPTGFFALAAGSAGFGTRGPDRVGQDGDLETGDVIPFIGQAGDGENDELFFFVDVDGVLSGEEDEFDVKIEVDGQEIGTFSLDSEEAERIDDSTVRLKVRQAVDFDVSPGQSIQLKATTLLPGEDDGESDHEVTPVLENPKLVFSSIIETEDNTEDARLLSEVRGEIDLAFRENEQDELELGRSIGPVEFVRFEVEIPTDECTLETSTIDGRLEVKEGEVSFSDPESADFGVPDELLLFPLPEMEERLTFVCPQGSQSIRLPHWFAGFVSFHSGEVGGENELDESRDAFVIRRWQRGGDEGVYATRTYDRTATEEEVTLREETTLEIRGPKYGGN